MATGVVFCLQVIFRHS